jgi:hypothetical protein
LYSLFLAFPAPNGKANLQLWCGEFRSYAALTKIIYVGVRGIEVLRKEILFCRQNSPQVSQVAITNWYVRNRTHGQWQQAVNSYSDNATVPLSANEEVVQRTLRGAIKGSQFRRVEREPPAAERPNAHTTTPVAKDLLERPNIELCFLLGWFST